MSVAYAAPVTGEGASAVVGRPRERRFRAFNVGMAKTGTQSVAGIFSNYRSLHELLFADTVETVARRARGEMREDEFRAFIRWRDQLTRLDVDSSSYNCFYADVLAAEFPDAKFIFVIRDCWSWLDSLLNMVLRIGPTMPEWMFEHCRTLLGPDLLRDLATRENECRRRLPALVDHGLRYWSEANRFVLRALPPERSLIVRTNELSDSIPDLAALVGVPPETLRTDHSHLHRADTKYHLLHAVDRDFLADRHREHCADLMDAHFPGVTLDGFLARSARARDDGPIGARSEPVAARGAA
jgi:hypothetical protein